MQDISIRLKMIADLVTPGARVADIGCDHAYTDIYLASKGDLEAIIAMDLRKGPLQKASENVSMAGFSSKIELRLSDGFEKLKRSESDTAIISGMGGRLITSIISKAGDIFKEGYKLILSPQTELDIVRNYLPGAGFVIEDEEMCLDEGKYYVAIVARYVGRDKTKDVHYSENEALYGPILIRKKHKVLMEYLDLEIRKREKVIEDLNLRLKKMKEQDDNPEQPAEEKLLSVEKRIIFLEEEIQGIKALI